MPEQGGEKEFFELLSKIDATPFRVIPEAILTHEWDGVEELIIFSKYLSRLGQRKISGFEAAGGKVIQSEHFSN